MATARTLPLPHDIVHMLIDQLGDRKVDLASCSLVCRDWLQPCRSHLFRSLNVYSTHADGDFSAFIEFLASPGGQCIGRSVRRLSLQDGGPDRPRMPLRLLADILCSWLPSLQELEFRRVKFERDDVDPASVGTGSRLTIGKLVFHCDAHWQFEHFSDTLNVLHLFSDISQLEFWEGPLLWSAPADVLKDLRWSGPTKVQSLALVDFPGEWSPIILQAITQSGSLDGALDTLTIGSQGDVDEIEPLLPSLQAVAPCIRRLRLNPIIHNIHISLGFEEPHGLSTLPLETFVNLKSLILAMYSYNNSTDVDHLVPNIQFRIHILLLGRCTLNGLEHVVLDVRNTNHDLMLELDWDDMDRQLSDIGSLRSVRVDYNQMAEFQVNELEALLPRTVGRGILRLRPATHTEHWTRTPFE